MEINNCRAIIVRDGKLVVMERFKDGKHYCVFPGGRLEKNESYEECVTRELMEEFGITVKPVKMLYKFYIKGNIQAFFWCEWLSGDIHITDGEEYQADRNRGEYNPTTILLSQTEEKNLVPKEIVKQFKIDYSNDNWLKNKPVQDIWSNE